MSKRRTTYGNLSRTANARLTRLEEKLAAERAATEKRMADARQHISDVVASALVEDQSVAEKLGDFKEADLRRFVKFWADGSIDEYITKYAAMKQAAKQKKAAAAPQAEPEQEVAPQAPAFTPMQGLYAQPPQGNPYQQ